MKKCLSRFIVNPIEGKEYFLLNDVQIIEQEGPHSLSSTRLKRLIMSQKRVNRVRER